ncbi:MAG: adenylate/guanylate cyclase domain-containing protein [Proteobacteria bacterium]|nr:adenylate/guanylate cyclase domain-containing protein [Pseudomonadota bacterium]
MSWPALKRFGSRFGLGRSICLALLAALVMLRIADPAPLEALRSRTFDLYQRVEPRVASVRPAVIVDIDEASLKSVGQWPWPRTVLADLVTKLTRMGAAVIAFDIIFAERDRLSPAVAADSFRDLDPAMRAELAKLPDSDAVFAEAIRHSRVVLGESGLHLALTEGAAVPPVVGFAMMGPDPKRFLIDYPGLIGNIPTLEGAAAGRGMLTIQPEPDGIVRRVPMAIVAHNMMMPALTLEMLRVVTGAGAFRIKSDAAGVRSIAIPALDMPTDRNGQLWIHFAPYDVGRYVSANDVLQGRVPADRIARKLVLIGTSAVGLRDIKATPIDPAMSGVEVHAQVLESILSNAVLARPGYAIGAELAITVLFALAIIALAPVLGAAPMLGLGAIVGAALAAGSWLFFAEKRILFDATFPLLATFLVYLALIFINYFREQLQRHRIRTAFGQYLAPELVAQLAHSHETLTLGGEDRNMTIMFSDVRGFTTISEIYKDDPQGLTTLMNNFLTPLTNAIIANNGTIDKYIGDAIMAFWNAPLHDSQHEVNACRAALEMLRQVEALNVRREREAADSGQRFIPINVGIGINTGRCVVGNMGSDLRFNYSVLGDSVNLASRLEGQSKNYGVRIIIGSRTAEAVGNKFALLELDVITVKGKTEPETVYAVLGDAEVAAGEDYRKLREVFSDLLRLYRTRDFDGAEQMILRCRDAAKPFGLDRLVDIYTLRIASFQKEGPPLDWNGVFALETK